MMARDRARQPVLFPTAKGVEIADVEDRKTDELVLGFVGPIGSGISLCAKIFYDLLIEQFGYSGEIIKVSDVINQNAGIVGDVQVSSTDERRTEKLQRLGTKLRESFGNTYLIEKVISEINIKRGEPKDIPQPRRHFTIVDSIKHPGEVKRLQEVYGDTFWLIGVFAPDDIRKARLESLGLPQSYVLEIATRDEDEGLNSGQRVRDAMFLADIFIRNDAENDIALKKSVERFLDVIFGVGVQTPTKDESAMYAAASAAAESACLSRQVGAVITNAAGEIIGMGNNDVPKFGGGLYSLEQKDGDHRCYQWRGKICHNDDRKLDILQKIVTALTQEGVVDRKKASKAMAVLQKSDVRSLIEFSRAVHAEMEAIISVGRSGAGGMVEGTLYSTTFPCHSCARHIVAAGISRVIYIEPYTKSLALKLHEDAISIQEKDVGQKVLFLQYEGVAPRNMIRLFNSRGSRKFEGKLLLTNRKEAKPASQAPLDGFEARERLIVARLSQLEQSKSQGAPHA